jgi:hypothetical protein
VIVITGSNPLKTRLLADLFTKNVRIGKGEIRRVQNGDRAFTLWENLKKV